MNCRHLSIKCEALQIGHDMIDNADAVALVIFCDRADFAIFERISSSRTRARESTQGIDRCTLGLQNRCLLSISKLFA